MEQFVKIKVSDVFTHDVGWKRVCDEALINLRHVSVVEKRLESLNGDNRIILDNGRIYETREDWSKICSNIKIL